MYNDVLVPAVLLLSPVSVGLSVTMDMMEAVPTCASTLALYWSWKVNASFYCARTSLSWGFLALTESKIQTILEETRASFILILVDEIWVRGLQQEGGVLKDDLQWQNWCPLLQAALNHAIWLSPLFDCPKHSRRPVDSILDAVFTVSPKRQYRGMVSPTTPATQGPERHSSHVTWIHWQTNLIFSSDTQKTYWEHRRRVYEDLIGLGACCNQSKVKCCSGFHADVSCLRKAVCGRPSVLVIWEKFVQRSWKLKDYHNLILKRSFSMWENWSSDPVACPVTHWNRIKNQPWECRGAGSTLDHPVSLSWKRGHC